MRNLTPFEAFFYCCIASTWLVVLAGLLVFFRNIRSQKLKMSEQERIIDGFIPMINDMSDDERRQFADVLSRSLAEYERTHLNVRPSVGINSIQQRVNARQSRMQAIAPAAVFGGGMGIDNILGPAVHVMGNPLAVGSMAIPQRQANPPAAAAVATPTIDPPQVGEKREREEPPASEPIKASFSTGVHGLQQYQGDDVDEAVEAAGLGDTLAMLFKLEELLKPEQEDPELNSMLDTLDTDIQLEKYDSNDRRTDLRINDCSRYLMPPSTPRLCRSAGMCSKSSGPEFEWPKQRSYKIGMPITYPGDFLTDAFEFDMNFGDRCNFEDTSKYGWSLRSILRTDGEGGGHAEAFADFVREFATRGLVAARTCRLSGLMEHPDLVFRDQADRAFGYLAVLQVWFSMLMDPLSKRVSEVKAVLGRASEIESDPFGDLPPPKRRRLTRRVHTRPTLAQTIQDGIALLDIMRIIAVCAFVTRKLHTLISNHKSPAYDHVFRGFCLARIVLDFAKPRTMIELAKANDSGAVVEYIARAAAAIHAVEADCAYSPNGADIISRSMRLGGMLGPLAVRRLHESNNPLFFRIYASKQSSVVVVIRHATYVSLSIEHPSLKLCDAPHTFMYDSALVGTALLRLYNDAVSKTRAPASAATGSDSLENTPAMLNHIIYQCSSGLGLRPEPTERVFRNVAYCDMANVTREQIESYGGCLLSVTSQVDHDDELAPWVVHLLPLRGVNVLGESNFITQIDGHNNAIVDASAAYVCYEYETSGDCNARTLCMTPAIMFLACVGFDYQSLFNGEEPTQKLSSNSKKKIYESELWRFLSQDLFFDGLRAICAIACRLAAASAPCSHLRGLLPGDDDEMVIAAETAAWFISMVGRISEHAVSNNHRYSEVSHQRPESDSVCPIARYMRFLDLVAAGNKNHLMFVEELRRLVVAMLHSEVNVAESYDYIYTLGAKMSLCRSEFIPPTVCYQSPEAAGDGTIFVRSGMPSDNDMVNGLLVRFNDAGRMLSVKNGCSSCGLSSLDCRDYPGEPSDKKLVYPQTLRFDKVGHNVPLPVNAIAYRLGLAYGTDTVYGAVLERNGAPTSDWVRTCDSDGRVLRWFAQASARVGSSWRSKYPHSIRPGSGGDGCAFTMADSHKRRSDFYPPRCPCRTKDAADAAIAPPDLYINFDVKRTKEGAGSGMRLLPGTYYSHWYNVVYHKNETEPTLEAAHRWGQTKKFAEAMVKAAPLRLEELPIDFAVSRSSGGDHRVESLRVAVHQSLKQDGDKYIQAVHAPTIPMLYPVRGTDVHVTSVLGVLGFLADVERAGVLGDLPINFLAHLKCDMYNGPQFLPGAPYFKLSMLPFWLGDEDIYDSSKVFTVGELVESMSGSTSADSSGANISAQQVVLELICSVLSDLDELQSLADEGTPEPLSSGCLSAGDREFIYYFGRATEQRSWDGGRLKIADLLRTCTLLVFKYPVICSSSLARTWGGSMSDVSSSVCQLVKTIMPFQAEIAANTPWEVLPHDRASVIPKNTTRMQRVFDDASTGRTMAATHGIDSIYTGVLTPVPRFDPFAIDVCSGSATEEALARCVIDNQDELEFSESLVGKADPHKNLPHLDQVLRSLQYRKCEEYLALKADEDVRETKVACILASLGLANSCWLYKQSDIAAAKYPYQDSGSPEKSDIRETSGLSIMRLVRRALCDMLTPINVPDLLVRLRHNKYLYLKTRFGGTELVEAILAWAMGRVVVGGSRKSRLFPLHPAYLLPHIKLMLNNRAKHSWLPCKLPSASEYWAAMRATKQDTLLPDGEICDLDFVFPHGPSDGNWSHTDHQSLVMQAHKHELDHINATVNQLYRLIHFPNGDDVTNIANVLTRSWSINILDPQIITRILFADPHVAYKPPVASGRLILDMVRPDSADDSSGEHKQDYFFPHPSIYPQTAGAYLQHRATLDARCRSNNAFVWVYHTPPDHDPAVPYIPSPEYFYLLTFKACLLEWIGRLPPGSEMARILWEFMGLHVTESKAKISIGRKEMPPMQLLDPLACPKIVEMHARCPSMALCTSKLSVCDYMFVALAEHRDALFASRRIEIPDAFSDESICFCWQGEDPDENCRHTDLCSCIVSKFDPTDATWDKLYGKGMPDHFAYPEEAVFDIIFPLLEKRIRPLALGATTMA